LSPEQVAVIECVPLLRLDVVKLAPPETSVIVPSVVVPSRKVTVPVILPASLRLPFIVGRTVSVKVTGWPRKDGFIELLRNPVVPLVLRSTVTP